MSEQETIGEIKPAAAPAETIGEITPAAAEVKPAETIGEITPAAEEVKPAETIGEIKPAETIGEIKPAVEDVKPVETIGEITPAAEEKSAESIGEAAPASEESKIVERRERVRKSVTPEMIESSTKALMTMLDFLGHDAVVKPGEPGADIQLSVESEDAGRIIGRKGQSLESLQLLLNRMMQKDDPEYPRIFISIDGYSSKHPDSRGHGRAAAERDGREDGEERRERRGGDRRERGDRGERRERRGGDRRERGDRRDRGGERGGERRERGDRREQFSEGGDDAHDEILRQQALDAAKEVRRWGEKVTLPEMNAHDRRIVHITLESEADLLTESEGDGARKNVVIALKKSED